MWNPPVFHIPHADAGALSAKFEERKDKSIAREDLLKMARIALKINFFEFDLKIK